MDTEITIYFREDSIEFWVQDSKGQIVPFVYNDARSIPLYFYLANDVISIGAFARDHFRSGDENAFGSFYRNIGSDEQGFIRFNKKQPYRNLLFFILKESILPEYIRQCSKQNYSFESFLKDGRIKLLFDYCLSEPQTEQLTRGFIEVVGCSPLNVTTISFWDIFRKILARKLPAQADKPVIAIYAAYSDLLFCLISPEPPYIMNRKVVSGRGTDPKTDLICEIIAEKAIERGGSMLSVAEAKKEVMSVSDRFLAQSESGLIEGKVQLSDCGEVYVQFLAQLLHARLDNKASLNLIQAEFDNFRSSSHILDAPVFLVGDVLNSDSYAAFFKATYNNVFPEWRDYMAELIAECFTIVNAVSNKRPEAPLPPPVVPNALPVPVKAPPPPIPVSGKSQAPPFLPPPAKKITTPAPPPPPVPKQAKPATPAKPPLPPPLPKNKKT